MKISKSILEMCRLWRYTLTRFTLESSFNIMLRGYGPTPATSERSSGFGRLRSRAVWSASGPELLPTLPKRLRLWLSRLRQRGRWRRAGNRPHYSDYCTLQSVLLYLQNSFRDFVVVAIRDLLRLCIKWCEFSYGCAGPARIALEHPSARAMSRLRNRDEKFRDPVG